jgi:exopolyphosphatase/pppGpp-phosphohydrolase
MNVMRFPPQPSDHYAAVRAQFASAGQITVLHIGVDETTVAVGDGPMPTALRTLAMGSRHTSHGYFKQTPPGRLEFEIAIEPVEDEITSVHAMLPPASALYSTDAALRDIALLAGVPDSADMCLSLEAMERVFSRLAAVIEGKPAAHEGIPDDNAFAATLLILREFMHHLRFASIRIVPA